MGTLMGLPISVRFKANNPCHALVRPDLLDVSANFETFVGSFTSRFQQRDARQGFAKY
jgi:hypothetical protein